MTFSDPFFSEKKLMTLMYKVVKFKITQDTHISNKIFRSIIPWPWNNLDGSNVGIINIISVRKISRSFQLRNMEIDICTLGLTDPAS